VVEQALVELYKSTDGPNWRYNTNWLVGDACLNRWYGIVCSDFEIIKLYVLRTNTDCRRLAEQINTLWLAMLLQAIGW
jgi:hypothetical protein